MSLSTEMTTVSEVLNHLKANGYSEDFNLQDNCLICHGNSLQLHPQDFTVDKTYRFEGISDPSDEAIVYAISSERHAIKGVLVNGYGIYTENLTDELIEALEDKNEKNPAEKEETKFNIATPQRPKGTRYLDAPSVFMDLNSYKKQIREEKAWKDGDRNSIALFKNDKLRLVLIALHAKAEMTTHTAPGTITVHVLEGRINFTVPNGENTLTAGQLLTLRPEIPHSVFAVEESVFLLTMAMPTN